MSVFKRKHKEQIILPDNVNIFVAEVMKSLGGGHFSVKILDSGYPPFTVLSPGRFKQGRGGNWIGVGDLVAINGTKKGAEIEYLYKKDERNFIRKFVIEDEAKSKYNIYAKSEEEEEDIVDFTDVAPEEIDTFNKKAFYKKK